MIRIRPVSDLRNKFPEIEGMVNEGQPVYLTKNGHGSMVVLSMDQYAKLTDSIELKLNEADRQAEIREERFTHKAVFQSALDAVNEK